MGIAIELSTTLFGMRVFTTHVHRIVDTFGSMPFLTTEAHRRTKGGRNIEDNLNICRVKRELKLEKEECQLKLISLEGISYMRETFYGDIHKKSEEDCLSFMMIPKDYEVCPQNIAMNNDRFQ